MKRRTSTTPVRVYRCGLPFGPLPEHASKVEEQIRAAHRYRNDLVAMERSRRGARREVLGTHLDVAPIEARIAELTVEIDGLRGALSTARQVARKRVRDPEQAARVKALSQERKDLRERRREILAVVSQEPEISGRLADIEARAKEWGKAARARCGVYWGTYLLAEAAAQQARGERMDPSFRAARPYSERVGGDGAIAVQLQGGLGVKALLAGTDTRVRLSIVPDESWTDDRGRHRVRRGCLLHVRVGSLGPAGWIPVWASFPILLHRPLPSDSRITWVRVQRRRIGTRFRWEALFTIESESFRATPRAPSVTAAVDLGWRRVPDGLRIATAIGEDGQREEVVLPMSFVEKMDHASSLRSIRDRRFEEMRPELMKLLAPLSLPDWLRDGTATLPQWHHGGRLIRLGYKWITERFPGDADAFALVDAWRRQDRHLHQWEASERDKTVLSRRDFYRVAAKRLATRFPRLLIIDLDLSKTAKKKRVEEGEDAVAARIYRFEAATGEFRDALEKAVVAAGGQSERVDVPARSCNACGEICSWNQEQTEHHTCEHCGAQWRADENMCVKMLATLASASAA